MSEQRDTEQDKDEMLNIYKHFVASTTMHGVGRFHGKSSPCRKCTWTVLVFVGVCWAAFYVTRSIQEYYSYPVSTFVNVMYSTSLEFPSVTICNMNPIRTSKLDNSTREQYVQSVSTEESFMKKIEALYKFADMFTPDERMVMGHQINDMLVGCSFGSVTCSADNFTMVYSKRFSSCYKFGGNRNWVVRNAGNEYGLNMVLNVEAAEYPVVTSSGAIVVVLQSNEYPFPEISGILIESARHTSIAVRKEETQRLTKPYGHCYKTNSIDEEEFNLFTKLGFNYSYSSCQRTCYQMAVVEKCKCCDGSYPCFRSGTRHVSNCTRDNYSCVRSTNKDFLDGTLGQVCSSKCVISCTKISYRPYITTSSWSLSQIATNVSFGNTSIEDSYLNLAVYFDDMSYQMFTDKPAYDWNKLVSDIGGQLGLWLGFSLITAMEIVELIVDTGALLIKKVCRNLWQKIKQ